MREITKLTISILYLIFLLSVMCVQVSNVTGTLFQLTSKVTTCADIYALSLIHINADVSDIWIRQSFDNTFIVHFIEEIPRATAFPTE